MSPLQRLRSLARAVRHAPDRLRHARRRAAASAAVHGWTFRRVLFLCHGNVCRSPYAAVSFVRALPPELRRKIEVTSRGFIGPGRQAPAQALAAAKRRGLDLAEHRSALVSRDAVRESDLVVVMSREQADAVRAMHADALVLVLGDLDPRSIETRTIRDPWGCDDGVFDASYARIDRCVRELARIIATPDHHGRGPAGT